jgi:hypothetical protein
MSDPFVDQQASGIQVYVKHPSLIILFLVDFYLFSHMDEQYSCIIRDYSLPLTPPKLPRSATWIKRLLPRPFLPKHLHLRYPWNLVSILQHLHASYQLNYLFFLKKIGYVYFITCCHPSGYFSSNPSIICIIFRFMVVSSPNKAARKRSPHYRRTKTCFYLRRIRTRGGRSCGRSH